MAVVAVVVVVVAVVEEVRVVVVGTAPSDSLPAADPQHEHVKLT